MVQSQKLLLLFLFISTLSLEIREFDSKDFEREVINSDLFWLIAPSNLQPQLIKTLNKVAESTKGVFNIAQLINQDQQQPSLKFYGEEKTEPVIFEGQNSPQNIIDFLFEQTQKVLDSRAKDALEAKAREQFEQEQAERARQQTEEENKIREKSDTIIVNQEKFNQLFQSREPFLLNVYTSNCSECRSLNKEWEKVTEELKDRIKVSKLNITQFDSLEDVLKITEFPSILYFPAGIKKVEKAAKFEGPKKARSINEWAVKQLEKPIETSIDHLTTQSYRSVCKNTKGTCVIFFVEDQNSVQLSKLSSLPRSYTGKPISFFYLLKGEQSKLAEQFQVSSYPNTLMIYSTRKTKWVLDHLDSEKVQEAVGEVMLGNRNNFKKFNFQEALE